jgi:molecular chaperone DnaK (HSP70)
MTQAAARSAGFEKVDIVKDTQLIVSSYLDSSLTTPEQTILVINIGGRTTHASAVRVSGGNVQQEIASSVSMFPLVRQLDSIAFD